MGMMREGCVRDALGVHEVSISDAYLAQMFIAARPAARFMAAKASFLTALMPAVLRSLSDLVPNAKPASGLNIFSARACAETLTAPATPTLLLAVK